MFRLRIPRTNAGVHAVVSVALMAAAVGTVLALSGPEALADALLEVSGISLALIAFLLVAGVWLSSLRVKLIATDLGYALPLRDAVMALTVGQLTGSLFFQLFGQLAGRTMVLAGRGIPPAASIVLFGYERILALVVSFALAACGALYLFGSLHLDLGRGGASALQIFAGLVLAVATGAALAWKRQAVALWRHLVPMLSPAMAINGLLSLAVQLCTLGAYIVAGRTLAPDIGLVPLAAASCVIMFAASLPISFAGWGLRELSAVVVLQAIGFSNASALVASLLIGVLSLIVLASAALVFQFAVSPSKTTVQAPTAAAQPDYTLALDWIFPIAAATAVFFQVYVPTASGELNVNLADPVVLIGGALFVLRHWRTGWPHLRISHLGWYLAAASAVILLSFLHGVFVFGFTEWAFASRTFGWGILLCYAATATLIVERANGDGYQVFIKTFVATGVAIAALNVTLLAFARIGSTVEMVDLRIAGFSQNPNAFAFVLLMAVAAALTQQQREAVRTVLLTSLFTGIWYTGSRAGLGALGAALVFAIFRDIARRPIAGALLAAVLVILFIKLLPAIVGGLFTFDLTAAMPWGGRHVSNAEHSDSLWQGVAMLRKIRCSAPASVRSSSSTSAIPESR